MKEETATKVSFWAYDVFGYLLPGFILFVILAKSNLYIYSIVAPHWTSGNYLDYGVLVGAAYTLGHLVSGVSSYLLERLFLRWVLKYPTNQMFKEKDDTPRFVKIISPGYFRPYTDEFKKRFRQLFKREFGIESNDEHDTFWLCWSYVSAKHPVAYRRGTHFLELYGFTRNMSMCFFLAVIPTWVPGWTNIINGYVWSITALLVGCVLFVNYTKLLRRLNDEIFRAFVVIAAERPIAGSLTKKERSKTSQS